MWRSGNVSLEIEEIRPAQVPYVGND